MEAAGANQVTSLGIYSPFLSKGNITSNFKKIYKNQSAKRPERVFVSYDSGRLLMIDRT